MDVNLIMLIWPVLKCTMLAFKSIAVGVGSRSTFAPLHEFAYLYTYIRNFLVRDCIISLLHVNYAANVCFSCPANMSVISVPFVRWVNRLNVTE